MYIECAVRDIRDCDGDAVFTHFGTTLMVSSPRTGKVNEGLELFFRHYLVIASYL